MHRENTHNTTQLENTHRHRTDKKKKSIGTIIGNNKRKKHNRRGKTHTDTVENKKTQIQRYEPRILLFIRYIIRHMIQTILEKNFHNF